jgi:integrase
MAHHAGPIMPVSSSSPSCVCHGNLPLGDYVPSLNSADARLAKLHPRRRPPPFPRDSCLNWHTVNLRSAASSANHPNIRTLSRLFAAPALECSDVRLGWQETPDRPITTRGRASPARREHDRPRTGLTEREVARLMEAAKQNRCGHRDATAILVAYRHGLRASELAALRWDDIDLTTGRLHGQRASDIGPGKSGIAQALTRSPNVAADLHLGTSRTSFRSRISAYGGQSGRGREIHIAHSFPHAAARLRVQARPRRPRHSRHPSLPRPPLNHVHRALYALTPNRFKNFWKD